MKFWLCLPQNWLSENFHTDLTSNYMICFTVFLSESHSKVKKRCACMSHVWKYPLKNWIKFQTISQRSRDTLLFIRITWLKPEAEILLSNSNLANLWLTLPEIMRSLSRRPLSLAFGSNQNISSKNLTPKDEAGHGYKRPAWCEKRYMMTSQTYILQICEKVWLTSGLTDLMIEMPQINKWYFWQKSNRLDYD